MARARPIVVTLGVLLALVAACRGPRPQLTDKRLVVLGFDGLDPDLLERWIADGRMPTFAALAAKGGLYRLETTPSPETLPAWASFATGVNPGRHRVFGVLDRDPATYRPTFSLVRTVPARFLLDYFPIARPRALSERGGASFWVTAGQAGVRSTVLTVPGSYPPEEVPDGELLSGLPLPDLHGTLGTYQYYATDLSPYEEGRTEFGGVLRRLVMEGDTARTELEGPPDPIVEQRIRALEAKSSPTEADRAGLAELRSAPNLTVPMIVRWNRLAPERSATIEIQEHSYLLRPGQWTRWVHLTFRVNLLTRVGGMVRMYLAAAGDHLQLYVSPVNWEPSDPPLPMSHPASFSAELEERLGTYRTLAWGEATWALNDGRMDEKTFLDDLYRAFDDRAQVILNRLGRRDWNLLVGVIDSTDRVQHVMWRLLDPAHPMYDPALAVTFGPAIERVYRRADQFVAQVLEMIDVDTPLLIVSGHGFHSWRRSVNLNTWLVQEGYMTLRAEPAEKTLADLYGDGPFWEHVDWSRTRAYAMGFGQIYLNLRGREGQGIVEPGAEAAALADELAARLRALADPDTGAMMVRAVYRRDEVYAGEYTDDAADLQVGFADGYRVSWQTTVGGAPPGVVFDNMRKWSGDHGGFDYADTEGVLISNRTLAASPLRLVDIAPTVLAYFGVTPPAALDGRSVY